jgi:hypothetical protein
MKRESHAERDAWTRHIEGQQSAVVSPQRTRALGRLKRGVRNKTEAAYESHLNLRKITGEVVWFEFEGITFRLADDTRYTPDFAVMLTGGILECHEVKGREKRQTKSGEEYSVARFEDDAKVKVKVAAAQFPLVFKVVYKFDGNWVEKEY